jgi:hypothetical protein
MPALFELRVLGAYRIADSWLGVGTLEYSSVGPQFLNGEGKKKT